MYKKCLLILLGALSFASCKPPVKKQTRKISTQNGPVSSPSELLVGNPLLKEYQQFLRELAVSQIGTATTAANKFIALFSNQDHQICDTAFVLFDKFDSKLADKIDELHDKDTTIQYDSLLVDSNGIYSQHLSAKTALYGNELKANGLRIVMSEGDTYVVQDMDFELSSFRHFLSPPMQDYLDQTAKEDKEGFSEDAGLTISPEHLADRVVWWENFSKKYPHIIVADQATDNFKSYLETLLTGMDNTPVLENSALSDYYENAYKHLQNSYSTSKANQLVSPYYQLLIKKDTGGTRKLLQRYQEQRIISQEEGR